MIVFVVAAIVGSALGLSVRKGLVAFALSLALTGAVQYGLILACQFLLQRTPGQPLVIAIQAAVGTDPWAIAPSLLAAGMASGIAAALLTMGRKDEPTQFWLPGQRAGGRGRSTGIQAKTGVEERAIHDRAERRIDRIIRS